MSLLVVFIAGDLGNVSVLACFFVYGSSISSGSKSTIFLVVTFLLSSISPLFFIFPGLFKGFGFLFGLIILILVLMLILEDCAVFWLGFFRLITRFGIHF